MDGAIIQSGLTNTGNGLTEDHKWTPEITTFTNGSFLDGFERLTKTEEQDWTTKLTHFEDYLIAFYLITVGIAGLMLNGVIVSFQAKQWRKLEPVELLIGNMAFANMIFSLAFPMPIHTALLHHWMYGHTGVIVYGFCGTFCSLVNIYNLVAMCVWRYIKTCLPQYSHWVSRRNIAFSVCCVYVFSFVWSIFPLIGWGQYGMEISGFNSSIDWKQSKSYIASIFCVYLAVPIIVMVLGYGKITRLLRKHRKRCIVTSLTISMCIAFILCWSPYGFISMWTAYGTHELSVRVHTLPALMAKSSILVHPILYFFMIRRYRYELFEMIGCFVYHPVNYSEEIDREPNRPSLEDGQIRLLTTVKSKLTEWYVNDDNRARKPATAVRYSTQHCLEVSSSSVIEIAGGSQITANINHIQLCVRENNEGDRDNYKDEGKSGPGTQMLETAL